MDKPLRKCRICGKEANTEADLELFVKDTRRAKYGRLNKCRKCRNNIRKAERPRQWTKKIKIVDPVHVRLVRSANQLAKSILLKDVCEICNRPSDRASLIKHHDDYTKPLEVRHLCRRCHYYVHQRQAEEKLGRGMESYKRRTQEHHVGFH